MVNHMNKQFEKGINAYLIKHNSELYYKSRQLHLLYTEGIIEFRSAAFSLEMHLENIIDDMIELIVRGVQIKNSKNDAEISKYNEEVKQAIKLLDLEIAESKK